MADHRGRPFAYLALLLALWAGARWADRPDAEKPAAQTEPRRVSLPAVTMSSPLTYPPLQFATTDVRHVWPLRARMKPIGLPPALDPRQDGGRPSGLFKPALVAGGDEPQSSGRDTPPSKSLAPVGKAGTRPLIQQNAAQIYGYSFWRLSARDRPALAPAAQYGGSQSGVILTYNPFARSQSAPAILIRASATPDWEERELAFGLRWKPDRRWPISVSAERRFRGDAQDVYAVYLAGGLDALPVAQQWRLQAFGQAGYVSGSSGGEFYDAHVILLHPVARLGATKIRAGAGAWAGGQKGASRVDVGPTVATEIDAGPAKLLVQLDWRMRAAGDAHPKDGLALTVSTGF